MRTHLAIATALTISLPALPAGAAVRAPQLDRTVATAVLSGPGTVVPRPGALMNAALPRQSSPAAAASAEAAATADSPAHGALTLEARQLQGAEAIYVAGSAPANAQVTITLLATVSPEIPTILVSRHDVVTDATGRFGAVIPIASAYERGVVLTVLATSASGDVSPPAHLVTDAPNAGASVPLTGH
jgi:hypothetical protein